MTWRRSLSGRGVSGTAWCRQHGALTTRAARIPALCAHAADKGHGGRVWRASEAAGHSGTLLDRPGGLAPSSASQRVPRREPGPDFDRQLLEPPQPALHRVPRRARRTGQLGPTRISVAAVFRPPITSATRLADMPGARLRSGATWGGGPRRDRSGTATVLLAFVRVFISSRIAAMEALREAAAGAIAALGHTPVRAEDFPASAVSPQRACLDGVRTSEVVILILGASYGAIQASGLSATHEEYQEAIREGIPVLAFIQEDVVPEPDQQKFVGEVRAWTSGTYTAGFRTDADLRDRVVHGLHQHELSQTSGRADPSEMLERGREALPRSANVGTLVVVTVAGPARSLIRPAELDAPQLGRWLMQEAMFGEAAVLDPGAQTDPGQIGSTLALRQREKTVTLDQMGTVVIISPAIAPRPTFTGSLPTIIEEAVRDQIARSLRFTARTIEHIDPIGRASDVLPLATLLNAGGIPWRTRAEYQASPSAATLNPFANQQAFASLDPPLRRRARLGHEAAEIAADLTELIARQVRART